MGCVISRLLILHQRGATHDFIVGRNSGLRRPQFRRNQYQTMNHQHFGGAALATSSQKLCPSTFNLVLPSGSLEAILNSIIDNPQPHFVQQSVPSRTSRTIDLTWGQKYMRLNFVYREGACSYGVLVPMSAIYVG